MQSCSLLIRKRRRAEVGTIHVVLSQSLIGHKDFQRTQGLGMVRV